MRLRFLVRRLLRRLHEQRLVLVSAESLTGGLIGSELTAVPGASAVFWGGFVVYCNGAKESILGVPEPLIAERGPVSAEVAEAMAAGALLRSDGGLALAVTGIAGPDGGTPDLPVGSVWIAVARFRKEDKPELLSRLYRFTGSRNRVRRRTTVEAFRLALELLDR